MIWIGGTILLVYGIIVFTLMRGVHRLPNFKPGITPDPQNFSIVVPFRNEAGNLPKLLTSLIGLNYPKTHFEVILVDDFSTDDSQLTIDQFDTAELNLKIIKNTDDGGSPKKNALTKGVKNARNKWIVTTDADCAVPKDWLSLFNAYIIRYRPCFIAAPVRYETKKGFFRHFQQLDFLSLQGATLGGFGLKKPFLCNGANMCYDKQLFFELGGYKDNQHISSGDDIFLMEKFLTLRPDKVQFLKNSKAVVTTAPVRSWNAFVQQRIRWAAKTSATKNRWGIGIGIVVFLVNFWILILAMASLFGLVKPLYFLTFFVVKSLIDGRFLHKIGRFFDISPKISHLVLSSIVYPFYIFFVVVWSWKGSFNWKGRKYKK